jgi:subtilase family serine protease
MDKDLPPQALQAGYRIHVKNNGAGKSRATEVRCDDKGEIANTTPGPSMGQMKPWQRTWTRPVPALNANQMYSDTVEVLGSERVFTRRCVIDPQSTTGEANRANNTYEKSTR